MSQSAPLILRLLASSVSAASRAGQIIKDVMHKGDLGIVHKGSDKNDLQTEADRSAQNCIIGSLNKLFPGVTIIGEEGPCNSEETEDIPSEWIVTEQDKAVLASDCPNEYSKITPQEIVVWVDPLDGTSEYVEGFLGHVTVLIGLAVKGKPIGGVVHQPYYNYALDQKGVGRTLWGLVGSGVGGFVPHPPPTDKFIVTITRSHADATVNKALEALNADEVIRVGGAGYKVLLLLEGKAHAYVHASRGCKKWDTCGLEGILKALGGTLTDIHGNEYNYSKDVSYPNAQGIFATSNHVNHSELIAKIPKELKERFPY